MNICRLIFRKDIGKMLVKSFYSGDEIPSIEQELETFSILNGYNVDALQIIDLQEDDERYHLAEIAQDIKWRNGELEFIQPQPPKFEEPITLSEQMYAELLYQTALLELHLVGGE